MIAKTESRVNIRNKSQEGTNPRKVERPGEDFHFGKKKAEGEIEYENWDRCCGKVKPSKISVGKLEGESLERSMKEWKP